MKCAGIRLGDIFLSLMKCGFLCYCIHVSVCCIYKTTGMFFFVSFHAYLEPDSGVYTGLLSRTHTQTYAHTHTHAPLDVWQPRGRVVESSVIGWLPLELGLWLVRCDHDISLYGPKVHVRCSTAVGKNFPQILARFSIWIVPLIKKMVVNKKK